MTHGGCHSRDKDENWLGPDGDKQNKQCRTICVIQRPQPKNLVAEHACLPAGLQKFLLLRKAQHGKKR
jgi:hypothetical protein